MHVLVDRFMTDRRELAFPFEPASNYSDVQPSGSFTCTYLRTALHFKRSRCTRVYN